MKKNYKFGNTCANCKKCENVYDHESTSYYCNGDNSVVPNEYSTENVYKANNITPEEFKELPEDEQGKMWKVEYDRVDVENRKRSRWESGRWVEAYGTCDEWEFKE